MPLPLVVLAPIAIAFLTRIVLLVAGIRGIERIPQVALGSAVILGLIKRGLEIEQYRPLAERAAENYNRFKSKVDEIAVAYNQWNESNESLNSTLSQISTNKRKLAKARRARNSANIAKYSELIESSEQEKNQKQNTVNQRWNVMRDKIIELVALAQEVLEDKEELERVLA